MKKLMKKIVVSIVGLSMVLMMGGIAQGATVEELEDQIADLLAEIEDLQAQVAGLTGEGVGVSCTFTRNLYPGMSGADVKCLQEYLNDAGYAVAASGAGSPGNETEYFGPLTQAAVGAWQDANGVVYGAYKGYFGPLSQTKYDALAAAAPAEEEEEEEEAVLEGGAGSITDADFISSLNNEEVGEGAEDIEVAGLEIEADEGSDIELTAVRLVFVKESTGEDSSDDFEDYAEDVSLWFDGEEVARVDGDKFDDDNDYSRTITLASGAVIRADETEELVVAVSGIGNLDSNDAGEEWTVEFNSIRFRDAQDAVITDANTGDIDEATREFSFEVFATAADIDLKIRADDDEVNDAHVINVDDDNDTDDVEVLSFTIEIEGDSDVELKKLPVEFDSVNTTATTYIDDMVSSVQLLMDGDEIGSENLAADDDDNQTVTFEDLDVVLEAGETYDFLVTANFNALDGSDLVAGDTFAANIGSTERGNIDAEDESGEDLGTGDMSGTVTGGAHAIYDISFTFELESISSSITTARDPGTSCSADTATYAIKFELTAFDGDISIDRSSQEDDTDAAGQGVEYVVTNTTSSSATSSLTSTAGDNPDVSGAAWLLEEGVPEEFTLSVAVTPNANHFAKVYLESINWDYDTDQTATLFYTAGLGEEKTSTDECYLSVTP
ncbi:MAG: peptidoglycan-binding domain-containing protein [Candidatus Nealsonbacteria bacterium]